MIGSDYTTETIEKRASGKSRAFHCRQCKKFFSQRSNLLRHILNHKGKKSHTRQHCFSKFSQRCNLLRHLRTHTGEKPFGCEHCSKRFPQKSHLFNHVRMHNGVRPFECKVCSKKFPQRWILARHKRSHSASAHIKLNCLKCDLCLKKFSKTWNLSRQLQAVHSQSVSSHTVSEAPKLKTSSTQWSGIFFQTNGFFSLDKMMGTYLQISSRFFFPTHRAGKKKPTYLFLRNTPKNVVPPWVVVGFSDRCQGQPLHLRETPVGRHQPFFSKDKKGTFLGRVNTLS